MNFLNDNLDIYFRVDYGGLIGRGHLSRCLSLADAFFSKGFNPIFIIRERSNLEKIVIPYKIQWLKAAALPETVGTESWSVGSLQDEAKEFLSVVNSDAVVVLDHYALGRQWQNIVRENGHRVILVQDLCCDDFDADVLINYNVGAEKKYKKISVVKKDVLFLLGPAFALLNKKYYEEHLKIARVSIKNQVRVVGIYLGGIQSSYLKLVAESVSLMKFFEDKVIEWVVNLEEEKVIIEQVLPAHMNVKIYVRMDSLIPLYQRSELFIGACGVSFLERSCMGLWQLNFLVADNQLEIANSTIDEELGYVIGDIRKMKVKDIVESLNKLLGIDDIHRRRIMENSFNIVNGDGADQVVEKLKLKGR